MKIITILAILLLASLSISQAHSAVSDDANKAVRLVMMVNYGSNYDSSRDCYRYLQYCLKPIQYEMREVRGMPTLFLMVAGDAIDESYTSRGSMGLGGLFVLNKLGDAWKVTSSNPYLYNGRYGNSQLANFMLTKVGADKYAWTGKFHTTGAGGESESLWVMFAPMPSGEVKQVANFPADHLYESSTDNTYFKNEGDVTIADYGDMSAGFYPLSVNITHETGLYNDNLEPIPCKTKVVEKGATLTFNEKTQTYNSPLFDW